MSPAGQGVPAQPAVPQWFASFSVSTQPSVPPQSVKPALQVDLQTPPWHDCPAAQGVPQAPQLFGSVCRFAQTVGLAAGQAVWSVGVAGHCKVQVGAPATTVQLRPAAQAVAQVPQCCGSLFRLTQVPVPQSDSGVGQESV
jgi:hypothetical protein